MSNLHPIRRCSVCTAEIPADAPQALCPKCLLLGVASAVEPPGTDPERENSRRASPSGTRRGRDIEGRAPAPSIEELTPAFPQLQIIELIGRGGMGFVYKAKQPKLDRLVALKILPGHLANEPTFHERFEREARVLAKLQHPAIVTVYDFGEAIGTKQPEPLKQSNTAQSESKTSHETPQVPESSVRFFYLLLEYVDGVNLREAMRAGRFTPDQALAIVPQVCEALQYAHSKGVLHRDIKPENILLDTEGHVKIADFGIAKVLEPEIEAAMNDSQSPDVSESERAVTRLTATGSLLGTPLYMAPEQLLRPNTVDHRADIFSLGVVFYEMLTGELPMGRFAPPSERSLIDQRIDEVVMRALAKERELRQQSAKEMKTEVETISSNPKKAGKSTSMPIGAKAGMSPFLRQAVYAQRELPLVQRVFWMATSGVGIACFVGMLSIYPIFIMLDFVDPYLEKYKRPARTKAQLPVMTQMQPFRGQVQESMPILSDQGSPGGGTMTSGSTPASDRPPESMSAAAIEAKRLGLIEVSRLDTVANVEQQPVGVTGIEGKVLIEPYFSTLVQLPETSKRLEWTFTVDPTTGKIATQYEFALYPCDYLAADWSSRQDNLGIIGYILPPGAYDFRADAENGKYLKAFNAKDRSDVAFLALKLTQEATEISPNVSAEWQKAGQAAHMRFRLVPTSISHLDVPEECLIDLQEGSRAILTREGGSFTRHLLASAELLQPLRDLINKPRTATEGNVSPDGAKELPQLELPNY